MSSITFSILLNSGQSEFPPCETRRPHSVNRRVRIKQATWKVPSPKQRKPPKTKASAVEAWKVNLIWAFAAKLVGEETGYRGRDGGGPRELAVPLKNCKGVELRACS